MKPSLVHAGFRRIYKICVMKTSVLFPVVLLCQLFVLSENYASEAISGGSDASTSQSSDMSLVELWSKAEPTLRVNEDPSFRQFFKNSPLFASPATYAFVRRIIGKQITESAELEFDIGERNVAKAIDAVLGSTAPHSHLLAGLLLLRGAPGLPPNPSEGFARLKQCNETAPAHPEVQREAQFEIGIALASGHGTEKNEEEGLRWIRRAAEKGHDPAVVFLQMRGEKLPSTTSTPTPKLTATPAPDPKAEWSFKPVSLHKDVTIELPDNWTILNDSQKIDVANEAANTLGVSTEATAFAANLYDTNGNTLALLNVRFYDDIDISQQEAANASYSEVQELDNALEEQLMSSLSSFGQRLKQWKGTEKTSIGGATCFVTEYIRTAENDSVGKSVRLVRFFDGSRSFTLTLSYSVSEEAWLRPLCDKIVSSIRIAPNPSSRSSDRGHSFFPQSQRKSSEETRLWPFLMAFLGGLAALAFAALVLSRQGQEPVAIMKAFVSNHPWIFALMILAIVFDAIGIFTVFGMSFAIPSVSLVFYMLGGGALFRFVLARRPMGRLAGWLVPLGLYMGWIFIYATGTLRPYGPATFLMLMCCVAVYRLVQLKTDTNIDGKSASSASPHS